MTATVIAGIITGVCTLAAALIAAVVKRRAKKVSGAYVDGSGSATHVEIVGSASTSNVAVGDNITQTFSAPTNNFFPIVPTDVEKKPTRPYPREINQALARAKPFDRLQIRHNYDDLEISWPCTFAALLPQGNGAYNVYFHSIPPDDNPYSHELIWTKVRVEDYPKLKIMDEGHPAWIEGRIISLENAIQIEDNPKISFE